MFVDKVLLEEAATERFSRVPIILAKLVYDTIVIGKLTEKVLKLHQGTNRRILWRPPLP